MPSRTFRPGPRRFVHSGRAANRSARVSPALAAITWTSCARARRGVDVYRRDLGGIRMQELSEEFRRTRQLVGSIESRDLRRGFTLTLLLLVAVVWIVSLAPILFIAHRISSPIRQLTAGLTGFAAGQWDRRLENGRDDEVGQAVDAFNEMAEQLRRSRERLVYLTQMSSWQSLARKTAHELKNSLTPIRLTVEEMLARQPSADRAFMDQAAQIVVSEIETLERRVRAFSEFASEPPVNPEVFDLNVLITERVSLLKPAHPDTAYSFRLRRSRSARPRRNGPGQGYPDESARERRRGRRPGGSVMTASHSQGGQVVVEVHDSGPGLSDEARRTLFEPTITFKKRGMGLGLSIARKNALLLGGDITLVKGELGGAGFRVTLPSAPESRAAARMTRKRHIVIVDDEPNIGLSLRLILEGEGLSRLDLRVGGAFQRAARPGARRSVSARRASARRQRHRSPAVAQAARRSDARRHDLRARDDSRRGRGDAQRRVRLSGEAARARSRAARRQERTRAIGSAAREPALPRDGWRRPAHDRAQRRVPARRRCRRRRSRARMPACC